MDEELDKKISVRSRTEWSMKRNSRQYAMECVSLSPMVECIAISASAAPMHELTFDPFLNP